MTLDISGHTAWNAARTSWTGVLCSRRVPASVVVAVQDWANELARNGADAASTVLVSGWHSPLEQEIFRIVRRGDVPMVAVAARALEGARLSAKWREALDGNALCVVTPFDDKGRLSRARAIQRDRWILQNCPRVIVPYASPDGVLHSLLMDTLYEGAGPRIHLFPHRDHSTLVDAGAVECMTDGRFGA